MSNIETIFNFLDNKTCDTIVQYTLSNLSLEIATIYENGKILNSDVRKSSVTFNNYENIYPTLIMDILNVINKNIKIKNCVAVKNINNTSLQFTYYKEGDHFDWHIDSSETGYTSSRYFSIVIQLNDEFEGGDLIVKNENGQELIIPKSKGSITIFPSFFWHKVTPVTNGKRYTLVSWYSIEIEKNTLL